MRSPAKSMVLVEYLCADAAAPVMETPRLTKAA